MAGFFGVSRQLTSLSSRNSTQASSVPPSPSRSPSAPESPIRPPSAPPSPSSSPSIATSPSRQGSETTSGKIILIGVDGTKDPADYCLLWTIRNIARPGDHIIYVGIIHRLKTPMGYEANANLADFVGSNKKVLETEIFKKMHLFEQKLRPLSELCDREGVYLDITMTAGSPLKVVLVQEAVKLKATHVILDRNLRKEKKYYKEHLTCNLIIFSQSNQVEHVLDNYSSWSSYNSQESSRATSARSNPSTLETSLTSDNDINAHSHRSNYSDTKAEASSAESQFPTELDTFSAVCSSASHSRENSFIDLYMLNCPDGLLPVWSNADDKAGESVSAPAGPAAYEKSEPDAILSSSKVAQLPSTDAGHISHLAERSSPDNTASSETATGDSEKNDSSFLQSRRQLPLLNELLKAHKYQNSQDFDSFDLSKKPKEAQDSREEVLSSESQEGPLFPGNMCKIPRCTSGNMCKIPRCDEVPETKVVQVVPHKNSSPGMAADSVLGKSLLQPPPLCSICRLNSSELGKSPKVYDYEELKYATNGFSSEKLISEGGSSFVYTGTLYGGEIVAIKRLKSSGAQSNAQFSTEIEALSFAQHRNIVRLLGYCAQFDEHILVYEYVCNGSLGQHLAGESGAYLDWTSRYKIALGTARGLRYLHEECRVGCIIHCDLRPNNILVTHDFTAMVGDFGLAKLNLNIDAAIQTQVIGSSGYVAPEYLECGQVTAKTDIYSFGVMLLELITGYKAIDLLRPKEEILLTEWARPKLDRHQIHELVDEKMVDSLDMYELNRMVKAASLCIEKDPSSRLGISQILRILEGDFDLLWGTPQDLCGVQASTQTTSDHEGHQNEELHNSAERSRMLHNTSRRVSTAPWSWRNWVKTT